jgi:hypothetical protein
MKERQTETIIENGRELIKVPLGRTDKHCYVYKEDREFLRRLGLSMNWNVSPQGYVTAACSNSSNGYVLVARILMNAGRGQQVKYKDGDALNLRTENLYVTQSKGALRRDRDFVRPGKYLKRDQGVGSIKLRSVR